MDSFLIFSVSAITAAFVSMIYAIISIIRDYNTNFSEYKGMETELAKKDTLISNKDKELQGAKNEHDKVKKELEEFNTGQKKLEGDTVTLKMIESDLAFLERTIGEQKKSSHEIKRLLEENKMKIGLLNEKTKDNVELIAKFARGKEFDEFRKSIHMDDIIQKYENEIKNLKLKNMELGKRDRDKGRAG